MAPRVGGHGRAEFSPSGDGWIAEVELHDVDPDDDLWISLSSLPERIVSVERTAGGGNIFSWANALRGQPRSSTSETRHHLTICPAARDLALALAGRAKSLRSAADLAEAMSLLRDVIMNEEPRREPALSSRWSRLRSSTP